MDLWDIVQQVQIENLKARQQSAVSDSDAPRLYCTACQAAIPAGRKVCQFCGAAVPGAEADPFRL